MEKTFLDDNLVKNPVQDPMGKAAHGGLEGFLETFSQPGTPGLTIITDPEYYVYLWFHDANGKIIECPYMGNYVPKLQSSNSSYQFTSANHEFGYNNLYDNINLQPPFDKGLDLTPFVREASLPEIAPANGEQIQTLFGNTTAGSFSPYASDGSKPVSLQVLDTEYSILDAIFYPWMKDINSPWWYRPERAYSEWATPYPMATLEVIRPRMRYLNDLKSYVGNENKSRKDKEQEYKYYSYKFIGVKPTSYTSFQINSNGPSSLLRTLTMVADMCIVDLLQDATGLQSSSIKFGSQNKLIFEPNQDSSNQNKQEDNSDKNKKELEQKQEQKKELDQKQSENKSNAQQQSKGDMPGEDEPEMQNGEQKKDSEYADNKNDDGKQKDTAKMEKDTDKKPDGIDDQKKTSDDAAKGDWEKNKGSDSQSDANQKANDSEMERQANTKGSSSSEKESGFFSGIMDSMKSIGGSIVDGAKSAMGYVQSNGGGAVAVAQALNGSSNGLTINQNGDVQVANNTQQSAGGVGSNLVSSALNAISSSTGGMGIATNASGAVAGGVGSQVATALGAVGQTNANQSLGVGGNQNQQSSQSGGAFSLLGSALSGAYNAGKTAIGVVSNVASSSGLGNSNSPTTTLLAGVLSNHMSPASSLAMNMVGTASKVIGGTMNGNSSTGAMSQTIQATQDVRRTGVLTASMNNASDGILQNMGIVGKVSQSVMNVQKQSGSSIGEFGKLVQRITTSDRTAPTPVESYVAMVTKQDAKNATIA